MRDAFEDCPRTRTHRLEAARCKWKEQPNPGSKEAVALGCLCAVMDNRNGRGFPYGGRTCFYTTAECPLHGQKGTKSED